MRSQQRLLLAALALMSGAIACSSKVKPDKPMPLLEINTTLKVQSLWRASAKDEPKLRLGLGTAVDAGNAYIAGRAGLVEAVQLNGGKTVWQRELHAELAGGPGVGQELVVVGSSNGEVIALSSRDGSERWRAQVGAEILSAPAVSADVVVVRTVDSKLHADQRRRAALGGRSAKTQPAVAWQCAPRHQRRSGDRRL
jgi:outer membrane protein assembly factor BamB